MAQHRPAPARRFRADHRAATLAQRAAAGSGLPYGRDLRDHGDRWRSRDGDEFPLLAQIARLVHGASGAFHLRLVGGDLWQWRRRLRERLVDAGIAEAASDEPVWLEQEAVRSCDRGA